MRGLFGKVILVTGSTHGIGHAMAERLRDEGAQVMIHGRGETELAAATAPGEPAVAGDLADPATAQAVVDATVSAFGRIDGLVNNAGIYPRGVIGETTAAFFDHVFAVNARAPLLLAEAAIRAFRRQGSGGAIVNIASINAWCGQPDLTVYSMSKAALVTMTRNLADALGPERIRVNALNVGWTFTPNEDATSASMDASRAGRPMFRRSSLRPGGSCSRPRSPPMPPSGSRTTARRCPARSTRWSSSR